MFNRTDRRTRGMTAALVLIMSLMATSVAFAQGSIFGSVTNSDVSVPANGQISFFGYLDDTDEEIRLESSVGAGYDGGNWFDDFQNYLTEAPGNPYDYHFYNVSNDEGFVLSKLIPNNSFQQEDIVLAPVAWPAAPAGLSGQPISSSTVVVSWNSIPGLTYHVYRRLATSNGSFFRIDNPSGSLADPGVADSFFVDTGVNGVSAYHYLVIAEDGSGNLSAHSGILTVNSASLVAPIVTSITPNSGYTVGGVAVTISGSGFDPAGATADIGGAAVTGLTVVSPFEITGLTPPGTSGPADVSATNTASGLASTPLSGGFTYLQNGAPILSAIGAQAVTEGDNLNFGVSAIDPDGDSLILTAEDLPPNATFNDNFDGTGTFDFSPDFLQAGGYTVRFIASDGLLADTELVDVTVNDAGNQRPVLAAIGPQVVTENQNLNFGVSGTDVDGDSLILSAEDMPANASFTDNFDGTGIFNFDPDFTQAGVYPVTFIASDGALADTEVVQITVNEAGNQPPVLDPIGPQVVAEGSTLNFNVTASDLDADSLIFTAEGVPVNATFTDNFDGTGTFDFNPAFDQSGIIAVLFIVSDGVDADSEQVQITVTEAGNQAPILQPIGPQVVVEGANLNFITTGTDVDGDSLIFTANDIPLNATFADNFDGTGLFNFTPAYDQAGILNVEFIVSDGALADTELVEITVTEAGNQAPVLASVGLQSVIEGHNLNFVVNASDIDGDSLIMTAEGLPTNATFADNYDNTGTFDFTPGLTQSGNYSVTFIASDGTLADTEIVSIEVVNFVNGAPEFDPVGPQTVAEGDSLTLLLHAIDDLNIPTMFVVTSMTGYTFVDSGNGYGVFKYYPDYYSAGLDTVKFIALDQNNPPLSYTMRVEITTTDANQPPTIRPIAPVSVAAGDTVKIRVVATDSSDVDGGPLYLYATLKPIGSTFVDSGAGIGKFKWPTAIADTGQHQLNLLCLDDDTPSMVAYTSVTITVLAVNQPPVLAHIGQQSVIEGDTLELSLSATDPDGTFPAFTAENMPRRSALTDNGDGTAVFSFAPDFLQAGLESVKFIASDGTMQDYEVVLIQVIDNPQPPELTVPVDTQMVVEGDSLEFLFSATDGDSTTPFFDYDSTTFPINAVLTDSGNGVGVFTWRPVFVQSGYWDIFIIASDETGLVDTQKVVIFVEDAGNQDPEFLSPTPDAVITGQELKRLAFTVTTSDADSVPPVLSSSTLPFTATFTDNGDFTGTFEWQIENMQAGTYPITFYANDGDDPGIVVSLDITLEIEDYNYPPNPILFDPIDICFPGDICSQDIDEGDTLRFRIASGDQDGVPPDIVGNTYQILPDTTFDTIVFVPPYEIDTIVTADTFYTDMPAHMEVNNLGNDTAEFIFAPTYVQAGTYKIMFRAIDVSDPDLYAARAFTFRVVNVPVAAILEPIGPQDMSEGDTLDILIHGYDPDGGSVTIYAEGLPPGASFTVVTPNTAVNRLFYTPGFTDAGVYNCLFYVRENSSPNAADSEYVTITVNDAGPQAPVLTDLPATYVVAPSQQLSLWIRAYDLDSGSPTLRVEGTPEVPWNAVFVDSANGHGSFVYTPTSIQVDSVYRLDFIASDGTLEDTTSTELSVIAYVRGDADGNHIINIADVIYLINYIFGGGPAPVPYAAGDADSTGTVNISDASYLIAFIFGSGPPPGP